METSARSSLCLLLNITSFWGISSSDGGPNGVQIAKSASGGSSDFRFWPCRTLTRPLMSNLCAARGKLSHKFSPGPHLLTKNPEVLSNRQRKRTVKLRSSRWQFSGNKTSCNPILADSGGRNEFHISCLCSSSRSSECTNSYTD